MTDTEPDAAARRTLLAAASCRARRPHAARREAGSAHAGDRLPSSLRAWRRWRLPCCCSAGPASQGAELGHRLWALAAMQGGRGGADAAGERAARRAPARRAGPASGPPIGWRAMPAPSWRWPSCQAVLAGVQHFLLRHDLLTDVRPLHRHRDRQPLAPGSGRDVRRPLSEELLFRGFLLRCPGSEPARFRRRGAQLDRGLERLALRLLLMGLADVFANGLLFCWLLWRTGSLRVPTATPPTAAPSCWRCCW